MKTILGLLLPTFLFASPWIVRTEWVQTETCYDFPKVVDQGLYQITTFPDEVNAYYELNFHIVDRYNYIVTYSDGTQTTSLVDKKNNRMEQFITSCNDATMNTDQRKQKAVTDLNGDINFYINSKSALFCK